MADAGHTDPWVDHIPAIVSDVHESFVERWDINKVDSLSGHGAAAMYETAIDAGGPVVSRGHDGVFRRAVPCADLPSEDVSVELYGSFGLISAYLEVYDPVHERLSL